MPTAFLPPDPQGRTQTCPLCSAELPFSQRYPGYLCDSCAEKAVDETDRKLLFYNVSMSGGFAACYADTKEEREGHICYIDDIKCWVNEARFGGIVIQVYDQEN
jgi:hypothetical protein